MIIEHITGKPLHENLHSYIFKPLNMRHSYQLFYSEPEEKSPFPMARLYVGQHEVSTYRSLSVDWAGGGIISTSEDLLLFIKALVNHTLLKAETFEKMKDWAGFARGIDYGYGLMSFKFKKVFFLLSSKLDMWGNSGSPGAYMYYNPFFDVYLTGSFNQMKYGKKHIRFLIKVLNYLAKL